jgi:hypothetical protein
MSDVYARNNNVATCLKSTSGTIAVLEAVYPVGGDGEIVTVELAKSDAAGTMPSIGICASAFTEAEAGPVVFSGVIVGVDTSSWSASDELWVSSTVAGALVNTQPVDVPEAEKVGQVLCSHATGGMLLVYNAGSVAHTKEAGGALHLPSQVGLGSVTNDAQLKRSANDFSTFTEKTIPVGADLMLVEDSAASGAKKKVQLSKAIFPIFHFFADQLDPPNNSDWAVNALAPVSRDSNNNGLPVRRFDDTTEEGVGFLVEIPAGATNIVLDIRSRAETAAASNLDVVPKLYCREIPDAAAVESWDSGTNLTTLTMGTNNEYFPYDSQTIALSTLSLVAGRVAQFELTRNTGSGSDTLVGDWTLLEIKVSFT